MTLSRYKIKDTYATAQMLDHAMAHMPGKGFNLMELKNLMISTDARPRVDVCTFRLDQFSFRMTNGNIQTKKYGHISRKPGLTGPPSTRYTPTS